MKTKTTQESPPIFFLKMHANEIPEHLRELH